MKSHGGFSLNYKLTIGLVLVMVFSILIPTSPMVLATVDIERTHTLADEGVMGVVLIDDLHSNDYYRYGDLNIVEDRLNDEGYLTIYASDFSSWSEALSKSHYLLMTAPMSEITIDEITDVVSWFESGSRNLLISSRGDHEGDFKRDSMNSLLTALGVSMQAQDDNVYTTDPNANNPWYIETDNFETDLDTGLFVGVDLINFFSPSSVSVTASSTVLVYAEAPAYQSNENGDPAAVIYDDTDDGTGGSAIPLAGYEEVTLGTEIDHVAVVGTTLWADFDYGDSDAQDTVFIHNLLKYMRDQTLVDGEIVIDLSDETIPEVRIAFPHDEANLKGTVTIDVEGKDIFGIDSYEIYLDNELVSSVSTYVWDTTASTEGEHTIKAVVKDAAGHEASVTHTYYVYQNYTNQLRTSPKIMTYNIKESGIYPEWMEVMKEENADIVILVETGDFDDNSNELLNTYAGKLNDYFFDFIEFQTYTLQGIMNSWNGITILSRYDITESSKIDSLTLDSGSTIPVNLPFLYSELDLMGQPLHIVGAHLTCCGGNEPDRNNQVEGIINFMDELGDEPIVFLGDMNSQSPDDVTEAESSLGTEAINIILDDDHTRGSTVHTFSDVHVELNPSDTGATYPNWDPPSRIDYIFVNQWFDGKFSSSTTGDTDHASGASDHYSVDVILDFSDWITQAIDDSDGETGSDGFLPGFTLILTLTSFITLVVIKRRK